MPVEHADIPPSGQDRDLRCHARSVRLTMIAGFMLVAAAIAVTLSHSPLVLAGQSSITSEGVVATTKGSTSRCQNDEVLPGGTTAIRAWIEANIAPTIRVDALVGTRVVAHGTLDGGWLGKFVTIPIARVPRTISHTKVCFALGPAVETIKLLGQAGRDGAPAKMRIEYLQPSRGSWWSRALSVAHLIGLGRAPSGTWVALIPVVLMTIAAIIASWTIATQLGRGPGAIGKHLPRQHTPRDQARAAPAASPEPGAAVRSEQRSAPHREKRTATLRSVARRIPSPAWACACVAVLSASSWSIVTPPFQAPDEPSHFSYTQILWESGGLPRSGASSLPTNVETVLEALDHRPIRFNPAKRTISTAAQQLRLQQVLKLSSGRTGNWAGVATPEPPLYYALETIPYYIGSDGTLLDQLELMRLADALMAGLVALFAFLFLREALPAVRWAWTVGGLSVALAPLLGFIGGVVNPDAMLCAVATALFYCLARAFRRGVTPRLAAVIGATAAIGFLTKLNFVALAPGLALALLILTRRAARTSRRSAYRCFVIAIAIGWSPVYGYAVVNALSHHASLGLASGGIAETNMHRGSPLAELSYIWQLFLPRLPGMTKDFAGIFTTRLWFNRSIGMYGWLDTHFPEWVYNVALIPAGLIAALCIRALILGRAALRRRVGELFAYGAMGVGLMALVGADSYLEFPRRAGSYAEPRYLLPATALFAAMLALAARGAGRRWGPALGTALVVLVLAHDIFSQLLEVGRYYG